jgi:hypothetical protein
VRENAFDQLRLLDARDHLQAPTAAGALLDLDPEYAQRANARATARLPH